MIVRAEASDPRTTANDTIASALFARVFLGASADLPPVQFTLRTGVGAPVLRAEGTVAGEPVAGMSGLEVTTSLGVGVHWGEGG